MKRKEETNNCAGLPFSGTCGWGQQAARINYRSHDAHITICTQQQASENKRNQQIVATPFSSNFDFHFSADDLVDLVIDFLLNFSGGVLDAKFFFFDAVLQLEPSFLGLVTS